MTQFTVFYSWQCDLPKETNQGIIQGAIRIASNKLEDEFKETDLHIIIDEATSNLPGSPHIPSAIFDKISSADAFICDITTINKEAIETIKNLQATEGRTKPQEVRTVPNPNVMIELGYAIALLGWERIIMLFNTSYGDLKDAPFDIVVNRITGYHLSPKAEDFTEKQLQGNQKQLSEKIHEALKLIIEKSPNKPRYKVEITPEEIKRKRDISTVKTILETIHITSLKDHINEAPKKVYNKIFHFYESFNGKLTSGNYYLYDDKLKDLVNKVHVTWGKTISYGEHYDYPGGDCSFFSNPGDLLLTDKQQKDWDDIEEALGQLELVFDELLNYIHENYLEIDIRETTSTAWREYVNFMK
ncbi:MAG: hypothetical protein ACKO99_18795 [Dolichospermum sp.]